MRSKVFGRGAAGAIDGGVSALLEFALRLESLEQLGEGWRLCSRALGVEEVYALRISRNLKMGVEISVKFHFK